MTVPFFIFLHSLSLYMVMVSYSLFYLILSSYSVDAPLFSILAFLSALFSIPYLFTQSRIHSFPLSVPYHYVLTPHPIFYYFLSLIQSLHFLSPSITNSLLYPFRIPSHHKTIHSSHFLSLPITYSLLLFTIPSSHIFTHPPIFSPFRPHTFRESKQQASHQPTFTPAQVPQVNTIPLTPLLSPRADF